MTTPQQATAATLIHHRSSHPSRHCSESLDGNEDSVDAIEFTENLTFPLSLAIPLNCHSPSVQFLKLTVSPLPFPAGTMERKMSITVDLFVLQNEIRNALLHPRVEAVHFFQRSFLMEPNTDFQESQSSCRTGVQTNRGAPRTERLFAKHFGRKMEDHFRLADVNSDAGDWVYCGHMAVPV